MSGSREEETRETPEWLYFEVTLYDVTSSTTENLCGSILSSSHHHHHHRKDKDTTRKGNPNGSSKVLVRFIPIPKRRTHCLLCSVLLARKRMYHYCLFLCVFDRVLVRTLMRDNEETVVGGSIANEQPPQSTPPHTTQ
jgi:hypothetical protein